MTDATTNLQLPWLAAGQAQKHVTVNESLRRLDAIVQITVESASATAQPGAPSDGQCWIVPSGKSGAQWGAMANWWIAYYRDGAWEQITPREGWLAFVRDTDALLHYTGVAWSLFAPGKLLTVSATDRLLGRSTAGAGAAEEITCTAAGRALIDDADAAAQRATLGLGTAATVADNTLVHQSGTETISGSKTFTGNLTISSTSPLLLLTDTDQPAGQLRMSLQYQAGELLIRARNDDGSVANEMMTITRAGNVGVAGGVAVGGAMGGNLGAGTVNAVGVYDDGVLLCAPLHADDPSRHTQAFWDSIVPDRVIETPEVVEETPAATLIDAKTGVVREAAPLSRRVIAPARTEVIATRHRTARRYFDMRAEGFDARDPDSFFARLHADRAVPGMPTLAEHEARYPVVDGARQAQDKYSIHERTERMALAIDFMAQTMEAMWTELKALRA